MNADGKKMIKVLRLFSYGHCDCLVLKNGLLLIWELGEYCLLRDKTDMQDTEPLSGRSLLVEHGNGAVFMQACHFANLSDLDISSLEIATDHYVSVVTNTTNTTIVGIV